MFERCTFKFKYPFGKLLFSGLTLILPVLAQAATIEVMVLDPRSFSPREITIEVGDTVRWINASGGNRHDVTADDFSWNSVTSPGFTFERTFNTAGDILYHCTVHSRPASQGGVNMNGTVHVQAAVPMTDVGVDAVEATDGAYQTGTAFEASATLTNNSGEDSGDFNIKYYASADVTITAADTLLATQNITNIAMDASKNFAASLTLPASLAAGDYFIGAIIDLDDTNTGNNSNVDAAPIFVYRDFIINAGLNDAWFDPVTDGQGFFITVFPDLNAVTLAWFTYDTEEPAMDATANLGDPGQRWLTAFGLIEGNHSVMDITVTSGGIFDDPAEVSRIQDGTITLEFNNCREGNASYDIPSIGAIDVVPIQRVAIDNAVLCEALLREATQTP